MRIKPAWLAPWLLLGCAGWLGWLLLRAPAETASAGIAQFSVYLKAWHEAVAGGDPYQVAAFSPFRFAPGFFGLIRFLPSDPEQAWRWFAWVSLGAWCYAVGTGIRVQRWRDLLLLGLGLLISWSGLRGAIAGGEMECLVLAIAVASAQLFRRWSWFSGLLLGLMPGIRLPWALFVLPFVFRATAGAGTQAKPFRNLALGYFLGWLLWASAIPSLLFGPERAKALTQSWVELLRTPSWQIDSMELGITCVVVGVVLRILIHRLRWVREDRGPLGWLTPWLIFAQLLNPSLSVAAGVMTVGAGFSLQCVKFRREYRPWSVGVLGALFLAQFTGMPSAWFWLALVLL